MVGALFAALSSSQAASEAASRVCACVVLLVSCASGSSQSEQSEAAVEEQVGGCLHIFVAGKVRLHGFLVAPPCQGHQLLHSLLVCRTVREEDDEEEQGVGTKGTDHQ